MSRKRDGGSAGRGVESQRGSAWGVTAPPGHLHNFGQQGQPRVPVTESDGCLSPRALLSNHVHMHQPVLMRGCGLQVPATRLWTDRYLDRVAGGSEGWALPRSASGNGGWRIGNLSAFLSNYKKHKLAYIPQRVHHQLMSDLVPPPSLRCAEIDRFNHIFWFTAGGEQSKFHFDTEDATLTQLDGQKTLLMVDPLESLALYKDFALGLYGPPFNVYEVDLLRFPGVSNVTLHTVTLNPGDVLYLPSHWWHLVNSLPAGGGGRNLMVSQQFKLLGPGAWLPKPSNAFSHDIMRWAMQRREVGRACAPLAASLERPPLQLVPTPSGVATGRGGGAARVAWQTSSSNSGASRRCMMESFRKRVK